MAGGKAPCPLEANPYISSMPDGTPTLSLTLHRSIHELPATDWERCAGTANPFVSHAFLAALEDSASASPRTGWLPQHAAVRDAEGRLLACAPAYVKSHSYGEYVFDHGWARAFEQAGGRYYPKLQIAVPFSPVPGPRLLIAPDTGTDPSLLAHALARAAGEMELSSAHVTFCTASEYATLGEAGWLQRLGVQYHWYNRNYATFDDFLAALASRKRKSIRRERRDAQSTGLEFRTLRGPEITRAQWKSFYRFYLSTVDRKWGSAYLTERFFPMLGERLGDRVVLMLAYEGSEPVAGALNLMGADALYGRNWGTLADHPFLHFELCYYRAIDFAIEQGLARVEAGAQGEHKIQRGYVPTETYSAHWIGNRALRQAIAHYLEQEREVRRQEMAELAAYAPFREEG